MQLNKISRAESSFSKELCQFSKLLGLLNKTMKKKIPEFSQSSEPRGLRTTRSLFVLIIGQFAFQTMHLGE